MISRVPLLSASQCDELVSQLNPLPWASGLAPSDWRLQIRLGVLGKCGDIRGDS